MSDDDAPRPTDQAPSDLVEEMLGLAEDIEQEAHAWAREIESLGEERASRIRRRAYYIHSRLTEGQPAPRDEPEE